MRAEGCWSVRLHRPSGESAALTFFRIALFRFLLILRKTAGAASKFREVFQAVRASKMRSPKYLCFVFTEYVFELSRSAR
jgi:hypothetical protein